MSGAGRAELGPARGGGGERAERQTRVGRRPSGAGGSAAGAVGAGGGPRDPGAPPRRGAAPARPHGPLAPRASRARALPAPGAAAVCRASAQTEPPANLSGAGGRRRPRRSPLTPWRTKETCVRPRRRRPHPRTAPPLGAGLGLEARAAP